MHGPVTRKPQPAAESRTDRARRGQGDRGVFESGHESGMRHNAAVTSVRVATDTAALRLWTAS